MTLQRPHRMPDQARLLELFERGREGVMASAVRIGTRGSPLARWQAEWGAGQLRRHHPDRDGALVEIKARGDRDRDPPLAAARGAAAAPKGASGRLWSGRRV